MAADPKSPSRAELSRFLPNAQLVRTFERLFDRAGDITPSDTETAQLTADNAGARAQEGLDGLDRLARALESLEASQHSHDIGPSLKLDYLDLTDNAPGSTDKRLWWDAVDGAVDVGTAGGAVTLRVGQDLLVYVKNTSGVAIAAGDSVMLASATGAPGRLTVAKAVADGTVAPSLMLGVAAMAIPDADFGFVMTLGTVRGIDATGTPYGEAWAQGDLLYFRSAAAGGLTKTQPSSPALKTAIGVVLTAASPGTIFVRMASGLRIGDLDDVYSAAPRDLDLLQYKSSLGRWESGQKVWTDIDFPIIIRTTGVGIPTLATINGNLTMPQWQVNDINMCESQEMIHAWEEGSTCYWHIHLTTNGVDAADTYVRFEVEYGYANVDGTWTFPAPLDSGDLLIPALTTDKTMLSFELGSFTPAALKVAGHVVARLKRIAAAGAAPASDPWVPMLQLHVTCDTIGSRNKGAK